MIKNNFRIKTKTNVSNSPKNTKAKKLKKTKSIEEINSHNIWSDGIRQKLEPNEEKERIQDFLSLYKMRLQGSKDSENLNCSEEKLLSDLEIIQFVYELCGEKTFNLPNWKEYVLGEFKPSFECLETKKKKKCCQLKKIPTIITLKGRKN